MMIGPKLLVAGRPGIGKTTLVTRVITRLQQAGAVVSGFTTREIRIKGKRVGFAVESVGGPTAVLAHVDLPGPPRVGRYGVDLAAFERIALPSLQEPSDVVVIDELGSMELASSSFVDVAARLLADDPPLLATVHLRSHPVTDRIKSGGNVTVLHIEASNRDQLVEEISRRLLLSVGKIG